jgi:hypothetical protein
MKNKLKYNTRFLMLQTWLVKHNQTNCCYIDKTNLNFRDNNKDVEHQLKKASHSERY